METKLIYLILLHFLMGSGANVYLADNVFSCTNIDVQKSDNSDQIITDVYKCLDKALLINLKKSTVQEAIGSSLHSYIHALHNYEHQTLYVDETNKVTRHELTAIQQDAMTTLNRINYITKNIRLPATYRLSNDRLITETNTFIQTLKQTVSLIDTIPLLLDEHIDTMTNLTLPLSTLKDYEHQKNNAYQDLDIALNTFQQFILQQIHQ